MESNWDTMRTDVLVIGSEAAGARAAIAVCEQGVNVVIVTKGRMSMSGATVTAIAGIAIDRRSTKELLDLPGDTEDSPDAFFDDIVTEGKYINNQKLVEVAVNEGPLRVKELADWGMKINSFSERPGPGHRFPRDVRTTGRQIVRALGKKSAGIKVIEDMMVTDLITLDGRVVGAVGLDLRRGEFAVILAKAVVLATGGGQTVYPITTAPEELTGDGQAIAFRAGAKLVDMEMVQFHPFDLIFPPAWKGIGFPFSIIMGIKGAWLLNKRGERFMAKWDPKRMENNTRDVLSIAIMNEVLEGQGIPFQSGKG